MSQLIQIRQRIKAIETIKKVTHAMRLISMSSHSRLRNNLEPLKLYREGIVSLLSRIRHHAPHWKHPLIQGAQHSNKRLVIVIGSQKGLCGSFNTALEHRVLYHLNEYKNDTISIIAVGKKAEEYIQTTIPHALIASHPVFGIRNITDIAHTIAAYIATNAESLKHVDVLSNEFVSFFAQRPHATPIMPIKETYQAQLNSEYIWDMPAETILDSLVELYLESTIMHLLYQSLLAEHAARFISMDNSTRNAENLLEETKLKYNKLRQAKITKELTELSASY